MVGILDLDFLPIVSLIAQDVGFIAKHKSNLGKISFGLPFSVSNFDSKFLKTNQQNSGTLEKSMIIETVHGGMFFSITYLAAFLVAVGMVVYAGHKKGYPLITWFLVILTGLIFFIIGNKVLTYSPEQWAEVFTRFSLPVAEKKTVLGGIIGLFVGIFLAKTLLGFNRPVFDTLAIALPIAMAISRIGCLLAGCCFGTPTNLPWAIHYDPASWVFQVQMAQGLVHLHDEASLAVHPAQIYQVLGCLVIAFIVWKSRKQWKAVGNLFLFSVLCYAGLRFFVEFVRAPETNAFVGGFFWGLKIIQWLLLGAILPGILMLVYRESKAKPASAFSPVVYVSNKREAMLTILLIIIVFTGRKWFDLMESTTIMLFLVPVSIAIFVKAYQRYSVAGHRWVLPAVLIGCISFMAQKSNKAGNEDEQIIFTDAGIIGMFGSYYEDVSRVKKVYVPGDCNHLAHYSTTLESLGTSKKEFWQTGLDISYNKWTGKYKKYSIGAMGFIGNETGLYSNNYPHNMSFGVSPYVNFGWRYFGFGAGFSLGQMKLPIGNKPLISYNGGEIITTDYNNVYVFPAFNVRLGLEDILFAEASFPGMFPSSVPNAMFKAGLGSGLGKRNGTKVSIGYCSGLYAQVVYPIKNTFVLEAMYADNFVSGIDQNRILSVGVHYKFNTKTLSLTDKNSSGKSPEPESRSFSKLRDVVVDVDGNVYHTLALGAQVWMAENLKATHFNDGSVITGITKNDALTQYNWLAASDNRKLCPSGWHVPSLDEWTSLYKSLGGEDGAADKLSESFSAGSGLYQWWSATEQDGENAKYLYLNTTTNTVMIAGEGKKTGFAVRCMRDN